MNTSCLTELDGTVIIQFDPAFDYEPLVREKRISEKYSNRFLFVTTQEPCFGPNSGIIKFDNHLDTICVYRAFLAAYRNKDTLIFKGHYGDEYEVVIKNLKGVPNGGYWDVTGEFLATCVLQEFDLNNVAGCSCPDSDPPEDPTPLNGSVAI